MGHQKHYQANAASPLFSRTEEYRAQNRRVDGPAPRCPSTVVVGDSRGLRVWFRGQRDRPIGQRHRPDDHQRQPHVRRPLRRPRAGHAHRGPEGDPTVYTSAEFSKRTRSKSVFVTRVLEQPRLWVIGSGNNLTTAAGGARSSRIGSRSEDHVGCSNKESDNRSDGSELRP